MPMQEQYEQHEYDVVIIGAGGAGLRAAIEAAAQGVSVGLVCKSLLGKAHTVMAEGGIAAALGNGYPIGAVIAVPEVADSFQGLTISTFGGNPVASTAALATLDVIEGENLAKNAATVGGYFREGLEELKQKYPLIGDVRGKGLMQGLELVRDRTSKEPADTEATRLFEETKARGLLIGKGGLYGNCIRLSPPLTIARSHADEALRVLDASFAALPT